MNFIDKELFASCAKETSASFDLNKYYNEIKGPYSIKTTYKEFKKTFPEFRNPDREHPINEDMEVTYIPDPMSNDELIEHLTQLHGRVSFINYVSVYFFYYPTIKVEFLEAMLSGLYIVEAFNESTKPDVIKEAFTSNHIHNNKAGIITSRLVNDFYLHRPELLKFFYDGPLAAETFGKLMFMEFVKYCSEFEKGLGNNFADFLLHQKKQELCKYLTPLLQRAGGKEIALYILALQEMGVIAFKNKASLYRTLSLNNSQRTGANEVINRHYANLKDTGGRTQEIQPYINKIQTFIDSLT